MGGLDTVSPPTMTVTPELAEMTAAMVTVTWEAPDHAADDAAAPLIVTEGATETEKIGEGNVIVMLLPLDMAPPAVFTNETEKEAPVWPVYGAQVDPLIPTAPPMGADRTAFEVAESLLVCKVTYPAAMGVLPTVKPVSVTVTAVLAASAEPPVVMTMEVALGAAADRVAPPETAAEGAGLVAKKLDG